jgi:hypothetical protein
MSLTNTPHLYNLIKLYLPNHINQHNVKFCLHKMVTNNKFDIPKSLANTQYVLMNKFLLNNNNN